MVASSCTWPRGSWGAEAKAEVGPGLAPPGVQVEGGLPPRPPAAEEGGEEGVDLGLVGVEHEVEAPKVIMAGAKLPPPGPSWRWSL